MISVGVSAQRFDADGGKIGDEFLINTETSSSQQNPDVATFADGSYVVMWQSEGLPNDRGLGIAGQRYDANDQKIEMAD